VKMRSLSMLSPFVALLAWAGHAGADATTTQVDAVFSQWDKSNSPGCSLAVYRDGEIVYSRGYGMADLEHGIALSPSSVFHIASVSKQFAAASVALLAQEGRLSLDDQVRKYVPELPDFGKPITIRQLVHHTSGLRDQWELLEFSGWRYSKDLITDDDVMSLVKRQKALNFAPGEKYSYSNTGYTLLAQIVQRVTGKSFREFTSERFFRPLGMRNTHFRDDFSEIVPDMAYGYVRDGEVFKTSVTNFDTVGATSLLTTVEDLALWDRNFQDAKVGGPAFLKQLVEQGVLNDGKKIDYAFGLTVGKYRGLPTVGHSGSDAGYRSYLVRFPEQRFGVACLCNIGGVSPIALSEKVVDIYLADRLEPVPAAQATTDVPQAALERLVALYLATDGRGARRVLLKEGRLELTRGDDSGTPLTALADGRFRIGERKAYVEFSGDASQLAEVNGGNREEFRRVAAHEPGERELAQYGGTYVSEEIEPPYRISLEEGVLGITSMKIIEPIRLKPLVRDLFLAGDLGTVRFTRDRQGKISGFLVNTGRVVDFKFARRGGTNRGSPTTGIH
jgi:CubicO group peptidase (beta-lactamase class C family)